MADDFIIEYKKFLDLGKTERECVEEIRRVAENVGYKDIATVKTLEPGDKVYVVKMDKSIALFCIGLQELEKGMNILGAHIDSPRLDVKCKPLYEKDGIVYLNTQYYGMIKKYQWLTIPLAIHGVVFLTDGSKIPFLIGENEKDPVFCISDILPHIAEQQLKKPASDFIDGENLDLILGAFSGKDTGKQTVLSILKKEYGIEEDDFLSAELEIVPAGKARDSGFARDMVLAYGQDDRVCAYASLCAMLELEHPQVTTCGVFVDKEEINSFGATSMRSHFFDNAVAEVMALTGKRDDFSLRRCLSNSHMLSSDVNSAYDPLNADLYDKQNSSFLSGGVVFTKYTGGHGKMGASDANPEFIARLRKLLDDGGVVYQFAEMSKVDVGGGGTIAHMAAAYGMQVIDCGISVMSMHAPWELTSVFDIRQAHKAYTAFLDLK